MRKIILLVFILLIVVAFSGQVGHADMAPLEMAAAGADLASDSEQNLEVMPLAARYAVSAAIGRERQAYHLAEGEDGIRGKNPAQWYELGFSGTGVEIGAGESRWGLRLASWGYGEDQISMETAAPVSSGNRVEYRRGALTEWYVNGPYGLQQGFTLASRPGVGGGEEQQLRLCLDLQGHLTARVDSDQLGLSLYGAEGTVLYRYAGLTVLDADGRAAEAWLEVKGGSPNIVVDDQGLTYPLVIDPFIQKAQLAISDGGEDDIFGRSVSMSGDVVVVGAPADEEEGLPGSAYVFVKPPSGWSNMTETAELTASDGAADDSFGYSVSLSGDVAVVGADGIGTGSAYVFVKPGGGWLTSTAITETAKLTASDGVAGDLFGHSVAVSGDVVVVGAFWDDDKGTNSGSAYVFVKPGGGWLTSTAITQTAKLTASDGAAGDFFGDSVSISGSTVVVGAPMHNSEQGKAYVFVQPGGGWLTTTAISETAKLTASDGAAGDLFGHSVAVSGDVVVVGASHDDSSQGSAYVFVQPGGGWLTNTAITETAKLTASDGAAGDDFGYSVSISGDTIVVGAADGDSDRGSAYVFFKPSGGWLDMTQAGKLTASDVAVDDGFGRSVSVSGDKVAVGSPYAATSGTDSGTAYVFSVKKKTGLSALDLLLLD